jgi:hypothetical protein
MPGWFAVTLGGSLRRALIEPVRWLKAWYHRVISLADTWFAEHLASLKRGPFVTEASNWRDVKAQARAVDPTWDSAERVARRQRMRDQLLASVSSAQVAHTANNSA